MKPVLAADREQALRRAIECSRVELGEALEDLKRAALERTQLGHYADRHPWRFLLVGFLVGVWLGVRGRS